jgi:uncharacterized lipoprotein NlpE involved in copper resistance
MKKCRSYWSPERQALMLRPMHMRRLLVSGLLLMTIVGCGAQENTERVLAGAPVATTATGQEEPAVGDGSVPAPGPATAASEPGQQVLLYHCGIQPVTYEDRSWEVEKPPFDATNAPDTFSGFGTFSRTADVLTFTDGKGARLTFTPNDGTPDPYNCA